MKLFDKLLGKAVLTLALPAAAVLALSITLFGIPYDFRSTKNEH